MQIAAAAAARCSLDPALEPATDVAPCLVRSAVQIDEPWDYSVSKIRKNYFDIDSPEEYWNWASG